MSDFTDAAGAEPEDAHTPFSFDTTPWAPSPAAEDAVVHGHDETVHAPSTPAAVPPRAEWPRARQHHAPLRQTPSGTALEGRQWLGIAIVAALIGALVGGGVVWATKGPGAPEAITIRTAGSTPGPAVLTSGQTIPSLVKIVAPSVVSVNVTTAFEEDQGTGMIISSSGLVLTNDHVVAGAEGGQGTITVTRTGASAALPVTLLGYSTKNDVALLQIQGGSHLPAITFGNSKRLVVGDAVVVTLPPDEADEEDGEDGEREGCDCAHGRCS